MSDIKDNVLSLSQLTTMISNRLGIAFPNRLWITAEIGELSVNRNGNCYIEFIEKSANSDMIKSKIRAVILSRSFQMIRPYFESVTKQSLTVGLKVMVQVVVNFHEVYGLSLVVYDINPTYTLGDMAQARMAVIKRLTDEGIINMNSTLDVFPLFQRIAIVSSATAAGYTDFCKQLESNAFGYKFTYQLFPAIVQGDEAQSSIIEALNAIYQNYECYDAVVIVRGGGAKSDLQCFNQYDIASFIAQYPLPVITGIGHDRDETIVDMVAYKAVKTPTAVAELLIGYMAEYETEMENMAKSALNIVNLMCQSQQDRLNRISNSLATIMHHSLSINETMLIIRQEKLISSMNMILSSSENRLNNRYDKLISLINRRFDNETQRLTHIEEKHKLLDPVHTLMRGYSITRINGKAVNTSKSLHQGDRVELFFSDGTQSAIID